MALSPGCDHCKFKRIQLKRACFSLLLSITRHNSRTHFLNLVISFKDLTETSTMEYHRMVRYTFRDFEIISLKIFRIYVWLFDSDLACTRLSIVAKTATWNITSCQNLCVEVVYYNCSLSEHVSFQKYMPQRWQIGLMYQRGDYNSKM